jgi:TRAF3-interacting protein 1
MTEGNVDSEIIKKTQETLGKFVKKPPLTEKLLKKPPYKFILDVVKAVSASKKSIDILSI